MDDIVDMKETLHNTSNYSSPDHSRVGNSLKEKMYNTLQEFKKFASDKDHIKDAQPGRMCGDGRYEENDGKLARFGADGGFVLGLLSLNRTHGLGLTPEQCVDAIVDASDGKFYAHTDEHTHKNGDMHDHSIGCGHLAKATLPENAEAYGVDPEDVKTAIAYKKSLAVEHPEKVEIVHVSGPHLEKAVIFNEGLGKKISHRDGDVQYFMVDTKRDEEYSEELFERLQKALPELSEKGVTLEDFKNILSKQTQATARILANGLPIFKVDADNPTPDILPAGIVS